MVAGGTDMTMTSQDATIILTLATQAAVADGVQSEAERTAVADVAKRLGLVTPGPAGAGDVAALAAQLSSDESRRVAYETAVAVCRADGEPNEQERAFLTRLATALGPAVDAAAVNAAAGSASVVPAIATAATDTRTLILDQAILTAACEILPDSLANLAILPLQLRLVYTIGQRHGQKLDMTQVKDLAGALGIGAAAQIMESVVRKTLGALGSSVLGGLLGGAAGMAAGATVTFASSYALGHVADQYYAQGRKLSTADLKSLFTRFQAEAKTLYPTVEQRVRALASGGDLSTLIRGVTT
jgi:tellurite resistance protein/uncharacterized protein (DUF697 family)